MNSLTLGFNFTEEHFDVLMELLNTKHSYVKIGGIYGSPGTINSGGSVREPYREATPNIEELELWLPVMRSRNLEVNLTLNRLTYPDRKMLLYEIDEMIGLADNFIVAHPGIIDLLNEERPDVKVIVSTIMNVHTLPQVQWIKDNWPNVSRICPAIEKNRDSYWLAKANNIIPLELLANEFCSMGGVTCEGLYRQACYMGQSLRLKSWCARDKCIIEREKHPEAWLMSYFILPQWLQQYKLQTGVEHFKITGRTHGPEYFKYIAETYLSGRATGNLLSLWGQLESTFENTEQAKEQAKAEGRLYIPIKDIEDMHYWVCDPDICGISCKQCKHTMEQINGS